MRKKQIIFSSHLICMAIMLNVSVAQGGIKNSKPLMMNHKDCTSNQNYKNKDCNSDKNYDNNKDYNDLKNCNDKKDYNNDKDCNGNGFPLTNLPDETLPLIFSHCTSYDKSASTSVLNKNIFNTSSYDVSNIKDSSISLEKTIKTLTRAREVCKKFNDLLTIELIGSFCQNYELKDKEIILQRLMQRMYNWYDELRLPALILIYAGANAQTPYAKISFLEIAVSQNDEEAVNIFFNHGAKPQAEEHRYYCRDPQTTDQPLFFFAKTKKMLQLFIENGVDVHEVSNYKNVLWHIIKYDCPLEVLELYLQYNVDTTIQDRFNLSCLLHELAEHLYKDENLVKKAKLLIDAMPKAMINTLNKDRQTPLDLAQASIEYLKKIKRVSPEISNQLEELIALYKAHGGLTGNQIPSKVFTYNDFCTKKNLMKQKSSNGQKSGKK